MNSCIQLESSNRQGGKSKIFPKFFPNCLIPVPHFIFSHGLHNRGEGEAGEETSVVSGEEVYAKEYG